MPSDRVLLVEENDAIRKGVERQLRYRGFLVTAVTTLTTGRAALAKGNYEVVLAEGTLPDGSGLVLLQDATARPERPAVVLMTGDARSPGDCIRAGAFDALTKPVSLLQVETAVKKAAEFVRSRQAQASVAAPVVTSQESHAELLGISPGMQRVRALIRRVARTDATVLIQGESGTGKEVVAQSIFRQSARPTAPFVPVNCAAVPENLIESEFFGHEKGAFTGALNKREGRFELAHGGTIFLDEVSEVSPQVQAKLLRVLQEREIQRVGGDASIKVDVRVIASTNRDLRESIQKKEFREDLFFRLNVLPIFLPPLRERMEDVPLLTEHFVRKHAARHGVRITGVSAECMNVLMRHNWPGNVRELQNALERAVIMCGDGELRADHLWLEDSNGPTTETAAAPAQLVAEAVQPDAFSLADEAEHPVASPLFGDAARLAEAGEGGIELPVTNDAFGQRPARTIKLTELWENNDRLPTIQELERELIFAALARCQDNRTHAARMIGVSLRTLRSRLADYRTEGSPSVEADELASEANGWNTPYFGEICRAQQA